MRTILKSKPAKVTEPKRMPNTVRCQVCGSSMKFESIELGYDCTNPNCLLHMAKEAA